MITQRIWGDEQWMRCCDDMVWRGIVLVLRGSSWIASFLSMGLVDSWSMPSVNVPMTTFCAPLYSPLIETNRIPLLQILQSEHSVVHLFLYLCVSSFGPNVQAWLRTLATWPLSPFYVCSTCLCIMVSLLYCDGHHGLYCKWKELSLFITPRPFLSLGGYWLTPLMQSQLSPVL